MRAYRRLPLYRSIAVLSFFFSRLSCSSYRFAPAIDRARGTTSQEKRERKRERERERERERQSRKRELLS